jgi:hypothetical protein
MVYRGLIVCLIACFLKLFSMEALDISFLPDDMYYYTISE